MTALLLMSAGCYHLRINPERLEPVILEVSRSGNRLLAAIQSILEKDGFRIETVEQSAGYLVTDYHFFRNDSGFGQPVGGRDYYCRLHISLRPRGSGTEVRVEPFDLELRSYYVVDEAGRVTTFKKRYPYEQYPGMFELSFLEEELGRVRALLGQALR